VFGLICEFIISTSVVDYLNDLSVLCLEKETKMLLNYSAMCNEHFKFRKIV